MANQIVRVDDALQRELCDIWVRREFSISAIIQRLRQEFKIEQRAGWERMVLYGRFRDDEMVEQNVGELIAIAAGIVILNTVDCHISHVVLSGLLDRFDESRFTQLFGLRSFSPTANANLYIWPSTFPKGKRKRFEICPAWISCEIGAGQSASGESLGIDPGRWELLGRWLDKWLPKPRVEETR